MEVRTGTSRLGRNALGEPFKDETALGVGAVLVGGVDRADDVEATVMHRVETTDAFEVLF